MEKLETIQKREKLNYIECVDENEYVINLVESNSKWIIRFQKGPRNDFNSEHGIIDTDLLEIVRHRLQCFQKGELATRENAIALTHIEEALLWMNKRVEDRIERNVLGTYNK